MVFQIVIFDVRRCLCQICVQIVFEGGVRSFSPPLSSPHPHFGFRGGDVPGRMTLPLDSYSTVGFSSLLTHGVDG